MAKIAFLGAGSLGFGRRLVSDILSFPELAEGTIHLMDPSADRLAFIQTLSERMVDASGLSANIEASTDREEALDGADYVIASIRVGEGMGPEAMDVRIPYEVGGLRQTVSDTVGVGGIMKGLRTIPAMLDIARDMERLCPHALLLNYTNPMSMIMWAISEATSITSIGLCHSVQNTARELAGYVGVDLDTLTYHVAGINHMAWFLKLEQDGEDLYPTLRACLDDDAIVAKDPVRFDIYRHFGWFVTESSRHMAEYVPYYMRDEDEMARVDVPHRTGEQMDGQNETRAKRRAERQAKMLAEAPKIERSNEYGAQIIHAMETDTALTVHGNVPNTGLITNLPTDCSAEVPCLVNRAGLHPCYVGALPPQLAALSRTNVTMQELVVRAVLDEDREAAHHAAMLDPNTSSQLSLPKVRECMDLLMDAQNDMLPPGMRSS